jgi:hypothetical protein
MSNNNSRLEGMMRDANRAGFSPKRKEMMKVAFKMLMPAIYAHPLKYMIKKARGTRNTFLIYGNHGEEKKTPILGILDQIASPGAYWREISQAKQDDLRDYLNQLLGGLSEMNPKSNKDNDLINAIHQMLTALDMAEGGRRKTKRTRHARKSGKAKRHTRRR